MADNQPHRVPAGLCMLHVKPRGLPMNADIGGAPSQASVPAERRAIVIGASLAGLLAARMLSEHFDEVVLFERDELPEAAGPRKGTPHAIHPHGLLARGRQLIEEFFPGFTAALVARGALTADIGLNVAFDINRTRLARTKMGVLLLAASRFAIEGEIRRRMRTRPGVVFRTGCDVVSPQHQSGQVSGVRYRAAGRGDEALTLDAALVVDASGRGSRAPAWLREWGYDAVREERVTVNICYASAYFRRDPTQVPEWVGIIGGSSLDLPCPAALIAQEPDASGQARWVLVLGGYGGDHFPVTIEAMHERAVAIGAQEIAALTHADQLIGAPFRYMFVHNQRRRYAALRHFPDGFIVFGDAIASFNPIYGQGMTVASCQALALREALQGGMTGLAQRFFRAADKAIATPWALAVGGDLALPQVQGKRPPGLSLINGFVAKVQRAAVDDPALAAAFLRVLHMLAGPTSLLAPGILWRLLRHRPASSARPVAAAQA